MLDIQFLNPQSYVDNNVTGFLNVLENCKIFRVKHLLYASSSSVYGANKKIPFSEKDGVNHPISFYAVTKRSNELMAHCYSHLYNFTNNRFTFFYSIWSMGKTRYGNVYICKSNEEQKKNKY